MRILVTGSNGFIGNYVCNQLKEDHEVIGIGTTSKSVVSNIKYYQAFIESSNFVSEIKEQVKFCDVIIHLAAYINGNNFNEKLIDINCKGTLNIVQLGKELKVKKIIHSSSLPIIGEPLVLPITEEHKLHPNTLYHTSKLMAENIINLGSIYNITPINLRIPSPIGIGMNENTFLPLILKRSLNKQDIEIYGKGMRRQNYIDVRDITEIIVKSVINEIEGTFNVASEETVSNIELAKLCIKLTKSSSKIIYSDNEDPEESYSWETSIEKIKSVLLYKPKYTLNDTISGLLSYWNNSGKL